MSETIVRMHRRGWRIPVALRNWALRRRWLTAPTGPEPRTDAAVGR